MNNQVSILRGFSIKVDGLAGYFEAVRQAVNHIRRGRRRERNQGRLRSVERRRLRRDARRLLP